MRSEQTSEIWVSFDVGLVNLAYVKSKINTSTYTIETILNAKNIDLTNLPHTKVSRENCTLYHSNDVYDRIQHFIQEYEDEFLDVDKVRIERQPITGLVHVEQLLFGYFRSKSQLISPNSMHKHFGINNLDYDQRKEKTVKIAEPYLENFQGWDRNRKHDLADALCILLYSLSLEQQKAIIQKQAMDKIEEEEYKKSVAYKKSHPMNFATRESTFHFLEQFKYNRVKSEAGQVIQSPYFL